ncbi:MAG: hypothetical protein KKA54_14700 [Proteobacteria bacterium]|nr:hypothetical protein [Pseudomonadota bacterium]MBU0967619.1 hypothetical protein [Pseudomonadota bacterium]
MRKIICDQFGLHPLQAGDYLVEDERQYEEAYEMLKSPANQHSGCIVVRNPAIFHWFDAPARRFSLSLIHLDPVAELQQRLNRSDIKRLFKNHPAWVVELKLLEKAAQEEIFSHESAESWLRRILLGPYWQTEDPVEDVALSDILRWLAIHDEKKLHPLTRQLLMERLGAWGMSDAGRAEFFRWLGKGPFQRARVLAWEQILRQYPSSTVASWFQHVAEWNALHLLPESYRSFPGLGIPLPEGAAVFLKAFLDEEWGRSPLQALSFLSGRLEPERIFLVTKLQSLLRQGIPLEQDIYQKISRLDDFPEAVALAQRLVSAKEPSLLLDSASIEIVQEWLQDEYLPYYDSCATLKLTEKTEPFVEQFENWLMRNYANLLIDGRGMAYRQISGLKTRLADGPILLYVFDGLDYLGGLDVLLPILEQAGAYPENGIAPYLAFLPTETFIAKPTLVCGWMNSQLPPERPDAAFYRKLLQESFGLSETEVVSATDQDSTLFELMQNSARVYLYLDNQLDREYLHTSLAPYVRREKYTARIRKQAEAIIEAAHVVKEQYGANLCIGVCSDHGYTELPQNISTMEVQNSKRRKARSTVIEQPDTLKQADEKSIWRLKPGLFGLHEEMAIPLGYGCFDKKPKGATHGGCTPQEVAVPWFMLSFQKPQPAIPPTVAVEGEIFRRRKDNRLKVAFSNPNNYPLSIIDISLDGIEVSTQLPLRIKPNQVNSLDASFDATSINEAAIELQGVLTMRHRFGKEKISLGLKIETKGAMMNEFDDDFEF